MNRRAFLQTSLAGGIVAACGGDSGAAEVAATGMELAPGIRRSGRVRLVDHGLVDDRGAFLGLGVSHFTALWRFRHDRARLERDLAFLAQQGFRYYRMLSMVGWFEAWRGLEIAPVDFVNRAGQGVTAWPDYWAALAGLVDLSYDRFGLRTQITVFADAQLMPRREDRIAHLQRLLTEVVAGRESKVILLEVANEAWQNGFPGASGVAELRELTRLAAERTAVLVATTSNHEGDFAALYRDSAADIATWHFSRDRRADDGWRPILDCRRLAVVPGCPPVSSNEPIGPGASVASESDPVRLVLAAAYAFASRLPMFVFHSAAGVFGRTSFEATPAIRDFGPLLRLLPGDLPNWSAEEGRAPRAELFAEGCLSLACCRQAGRFVGIPVGVQPDGLRLTTRVPMRLRALDLLTGRELAVVNLEPGRAATLNVASAAVLLTT